MRLERVGRTYGSGPAAVEALKGVDLEIWPGEFVVLLGPSGSGKTTLLNLVGGIEEPTGGRIEVAGTDIASLQGRRQRTAYRRDRVGFVFQFFNLVPTLTARRTWRSSPNSPARIPQSSAVERRWSGSGLCDVRRPFPRSAFRRRAAAGGDRAGVVEEPPLLLCDEPTGSLDLATGRQVLAVLRDLAREGHHTVLLVTHNSAIAAMADRVVWLHSGTIARQQHVADPVEAQVLESCVRHPVRKLRRDLWRQRWQFLAAAAGHRDRRRGLRRGHRRLREPQAVLRPGLRHPVAA